MRVPPEPRISKSNFIPFHALKLKDKLKCHPFKRRRNLHKLKKMQYNKPKKCGGAMTPVSGLRVEDTFNVPTGLLPKSSRRKPLVIASFSRGCNESPSVEILHRNKLNKVCLSKRRYKLKYFNYKLSKVFNESVLPRFKRTRKGNKVNNMECAETVRTIKSLTQKNGDVKVIFHDKNIVKSFFLPEEPQEDDKGKCEPKHIDFNNNNLSLHLKDYPSLAQEKKKKNNNKKKKKKKKREDNLEKDGGNPHCTKKKFKCK